MPDAKPPRRPRISLRTLLLLITLAAMGITIWQLYDELVPLRAEVRQHRNTLGIFKIEEPDKIHAIRIANDLPDEQIYKYRINLPEGKQYYVGVATSNIPASGLPSSSRALPYPIAPGEHLITFKILPDEDGLVGKLTRGKFHRPFEKATLHIEATHGQTNSLSVMHLALGTQTRVNRWHTDEDTAGIFQRDEGVENEVEVFAHNHPAVLLKIRLERVLHSSRDPNATPPQWKVEPIPDPCDGFMLWIESEPEEKNPL